MRCHSGLLSSPLLSLLLLRHLPASSVPASPAPLQFISTLFAYPVLFHLHLPPSLLSSSVLFSHGVHIATPLCLPLLFLFSHTSPQPPRKFILVAHWVLMPTSGCILLFHPLRFFRLFCPCVSPSALCWHIACLHIWRRGWCFCRFR